MQNIIITECPRDAMQGLKDIIPTEVKTSYLNTLLKVGFDVMDFGSFVSHELIPQMADTDEVVGQLDLSNTNTKLIAIVANERGAQNACTHKEIHCLGFPFSISETFQMRNSNATIAEAVERVKKIRQLCANANKELVIYISMGFGNPYGDAYSPQIVEEWVQKLAVLDVNTFMLSDTVGVADPENIAYLFSTLIKSMPQLEFGAHLHTAPHNWKVKIDAAYNNGCRRFDSVIKGFGGCPMAKDDLLGNMPTENLLNYFSVEQLGSGINIAAFEDALRESSSVFPK